MPETNCKINAEKVVLEILKENLLYDKEILLENTYDEIGLDSLTFINIIVNIETECKIIFEDQMLVYEENKKVMDLVDCVSQLIGKKAVEA